MRNPLAAVTLSALALVGCRSNSPPTLEVMSARATAGDGASILAFEVRATNPNRDSLPLEEVSFEAWVGGQRVFAGTRSPQVTLPGYGSQVLLLPASVNGTLAPGAAYRVSGELTYTSGSSWRQTLRESGLGLPSVAFEGSGTITP